MKLQREGCQGRQEFVREMVEEENKKKEEKGKREGRLQEQNRLNERAQKNSQSMLCRQGEIE